MVTKPMGQVATRVGEVEEPHGSHGSGLSLIASGRRSDRGLLARTIETEVVPRLLLAHRAASSAEGTRSSPVGGADVAGLVTAVLADDGAAAESIIESVRSRGATLEHVSLDLLAPAARRMGAMWVEDDCTYTDVTLGVWRLQRLLRGLSPLFEPRVDQVRGGVRRALIAVMPGEDHSFGTDMVAGFLRLSGWEVSNEPAGSADALAARVRRDPATVVGLSCGCGDDLPTFAALVTTLRRAAGRSIWIMLGGHVVAASPRRALRLGADAVALDARHAVQQAESLLRLLGPAH